MTVAVVLGRVVTSIVGRLRQSCGIVLCRRLCYCILCSGWLGMSLVVVVAVVVVALVGVLGDVVLVVVVVVVGGIGAVGVVVVVVVVVA